MKKIEKRNKQIERIEDEFKSPIEELLLDLYVLQEYSVDEVNKTLRIGNKKRTIQLLKSAGIYSHKLKSLDSIL